MTEECLRYGIQSAELKLKLRTAGVQYKEGKVALYPYEKKHRPQIVNTIKTKTTKTKDTLKSKI